MHLQPTRLTFPDVTPYRRYPIRSLRYRYAVAPRLRLVEPYTLRLVTLRLIVTRLRCAATGLADSQPTHTVGPVDLLLLTLLSFGHYLPVYVC